MIAGAVALVLVGFATRGSWSHTPFAAPSAPTAPAGSSEPEPGEPRDIRVTPPPGMDGKQTRDWNKIADELYRGHFEGARHKLREFTDKYGDTDQTLELGSQLDALGPDDPREPAGRGPGGPPRGRGKKHHDDQK